MGLGARGSEEEVNPRMTGTARGHLNPGKKGTIRNHQNPRKRGTDTALHYPRKKGIYGYGPPITCGRRVRLGPPLTS